MEGSGLTRITQVVSTCRCYVSAVCTAYDQDGGAVVQKRNVVGTGYV